VIGDDITPEFGQQEKVVRSGSLAVGGSAAITAVAAARLGVSVALVAALGPDLAGEFMRGELARAGPFSPRWARPGRWTLPTCLPGCWPGPGTCMSAPTS
jgi:hypothetical protein